MKRKLFVTLLLVLGPLSMVHSIALAQTPLTLEECYQLALKKSEQISTKEQDIHNAESKYAQAIGAVLPNVRFKGSEFLQDDSSNPEGAGSVGTTLTRFSTPLLTFNAKQPIFQGLREFYGLAAVRAQKRATEAQLEHAKRLLFMDVVNAFYTVIQIEQEKQTLMDSQKALQERMTELKGRVRLGKSRVSDEINTESELAIHQAGLDAINGSLENAKEALAFLLDTRANEVVLQDTFTLPQEILDETAVTHEVEKRPDIRAATETLNSSKSLLSAQKGEHFPTINAEANYYPYRVGFLSPVHWDALFTLDFPIFTGGQTKSKVQQAKIQMKQAELRLSLQKRQASTEINNAYNSFVSSQKQVRSFGIAAVKGKENYNAVAKDYLLGLTNNLEVLGIMMTLEDIRRNYHRSMAQAKINYFNLKRVSGEKLP